MGVDVQRIEAAATTTAQDERPDDNPPADTPIPEISRQPGRRRTVDGDGLSMGFENPRRCSTFYIVAPSRSNERHQRADQQQQQQAREHRRHELLRRQHQPSTRTTSDHAGVGTQDGKSEVEACTGCGQMDQGERRPA